MRIWACPASRPPNNKRAGNSNAVKNDMDLADLRNEIDRIDREIVDKLTETLVDELKK